MRATLRGTPLDLDAWRRRHNALTWVLVAFLPVVTVLGLHSGLEPWQVLNNVLVLCMFTALAASSRVTRPLRSLLCVLGLLIGVVELVTATGGAAGAHLVMYVVVGLVGLYEERVLNVVAAAYLGVFYGLIGGLSPRYVPGEIGAGPGRWYVHLLMLWTVIALAQVVRNLAAAERARSERLAAALGATTAARQQAAELHDGVLQSLTAAAYACELGDTELASRSLHTAVDQARGIVDRLNETDWVDVHDRLRRLP